MKVVLEPAIFLFAEAVSGLVEHVKYTVKSHIAYGQAREIVAKAVGSSGWEELRRLDVAQTGSLLESMDSNEAWERAADGLRELGIPIEGEGHPRLFSGPFRHAPSKPASALCAMVDASMTFHGIYMSEGGRAEHRDTPDINRPGLRTVSRRVVSRSDGVVGLDRCLFQLGSFERCVLDEAIEERLDAFGCVPFLHAAGYGDSNVFSYVPQFIHGGWSATQLFIAGNSEASGFVAQLADWHQRSELVVRLVAGGLLVAHRDAKEPEALRPCFASGYMPQVATFRFQE